MSAHYLASELLRTNSHSYAFSRAKTVFGYVDRYFLIFLGIPVAGLFAAQQRFSGGSKSSNLIVRIICSPSRVLASPHLTTRQYARVVQGWVYTIRLEGANYGRSGGAGSINGRRFG